MPKRARKLFFSCCQLSPKTACYETYFHGFGPLNNPSLFEAYINALILIIKSTIKFIPFLEFGIVPVPSFALFSLGVSYNIKGNNPLMTNQGKENTPLIYIHDLKRIQ